MMKPREKNNETWWKREKKNNEKWWNIENKSKIMKQIEKNETWWKREKKQWNMIKKNRETKTMKNEK